VSGPDLRRGDAGTAHLDLPPGTPGILALFSARPQTAPALQQLAEELLRGESSLAPAQREAIAAAVSRENGCTFCAATHGAAADALGAAGLGDPLLAALLPIAEAVAKGGRAVTDDLVAAARAAGADDVAIHDTVLVAAAFCMFNRYVDGLGAPGAEPQVLDAMGRKLAEHGYVSTAVLQVVDPVPGAVVDPQLRDAPAHRSHVPGVLRGEPVDPDLYPRGTPILQPPQTQIEGRALHDLDHVSTIVDRLKGSPQDTGLGGPRHDIL
jgi:AhpD family alkylhydroperoxidase